MVFYEAPHRIIESITYMANVLGRERRIAFAREITKTFETIKGGSLESIVEWVAADSNQQRGEIVLLVHGATKPENAEISAEQERIMRVLLEDLPVKQAATIGAKITGLKKNFLYQWALGESEK